MSLGRAMIGIEFQEMGYESILISDVTAGITQ